MESFNQKSEEILKRKNVLFKSISSYFKDLLKKIEKNINIIQGSDLESITEVHLLKVQFKITGQINTSLETITFDQRLLNEHKKYDPL